MLEFPTLLLPQMSIPHNRGVPRIWGGGGGAGCRFVVCMLRRKKFGDKGSEAPLKQLPTVYHIPRADGTNSMSY